MARCARSISAKPGGRISIRRRCCFEQRNECASCRKLNEGWLRQDFDWIVVRTRRQLRAPIIQLTTGTRAANRARRVAGFVFEELFPQIVERILHQRFRPDISSLRTPVYLAEFVDIKIATARAAFEWGGTVSYKALAIIGKIHPA